MAEFIFKEIRNQLESDQARCLFDSLGYPEDIRSKKTSSIIDLYKNKGSKRILGVLDGRRILGLIGLNFQESGRVEILHIVVSPNERKNGIGTLMINRVKETFPVRQLFAEPDKEGIGFYRRTGFSVENLGKLYPGTERFRCTLTLEAQQVAGGDAP